MNQLYRSLVSRTFSGNKASQPQKDIVHLFERFHRGRNASEYSGNGLGLATVKAIVETHDGEVTAHSAGLSEGSMFTVKLPLK